LSDTVFHLASRAKDIRGTPSYQPYSKVRIIVGNDDDGNQLVYEAGNDSARVLEITNPYGTQELANSILQRLGGFEYKPFTAEGALLNPAAELGDGISLSGDIYSFIASSETTLSPIMSSTVAAFEDGELNHEYPYETRENKEIARKLNGIKTSFVVELGKVESKIEDMDRGFSSSITQLADSITSEVAERKSEGAELDSRIQQTAESITAEVNARTSADDDLSSRISVNAESITAEVNARTSEDDTLSARITTNAESITSEVNRATGVEGNLSSRIDQTAQSITEQVNGIYAPEWSTSGSDEYGYYYPNDVVKITTYSDGNITDITYYQCRGEWSSEYQQYIEIPATNPYKPPNSNYWKKVSGPSVQSILNIGLDGITLGYRESTLNNSATITLSRNGITMDAQTITMTNVVADSIAAESKISSPLICSGDETIFIVMNDSDYWGYGGGFECYEYIGESEFSLFKVYYEDVGQVGLGGGGYHFLSVGSNYVSAFSHQWDFSSTTVHNVTATGDWDFSGANVTGLPTSSSS
jgi:hypothetical protein